LNQTPAVQIPNKHPPTIILGRWKIQFFLLNRASY
jgi:hypothetical protein